MLLEREVLVEVDGVERSIRQTGAALEEGAVPTDASFDMRSRLAWICGVATERFCTTCLPVCGVGACGGVKEQLGAKGSFIVFAGEELGTRETFGNTP